MTFCHSIARKFCYPLLIYNNNIRLVYYLYLHSKDFGRDNRKNYRKHSKGFSSDAKDNVIKLLIPGKEKYLEKYEAKLETE
jgi:hypothetical protein